jgi:hypothetical protein
VFEEKIVKKSHKGIIPGIQQMPHKKDLDDGEALRLAELDRSVAIRWGGHDVLLDRGFVPVVRVFFEFAAQLPPKGLSPVEAMFILHLMSFKWDEGAPFPGYARLATRLGVSVPYVKKIAAALEERGFLAKSRRNMRNDNVGFATNEYDLSPFFDRLAIHVMHQPRRRAGTTKPHR